MHQAQTAGEAVEIFFGLSEFGQGGKPSGDLGRILPAADHGGGLDQQLRVRPCFAFRQHHVKERIRSLRHGAQYGDAEPWVVRVAMSHLGESWNGPGVLPLAEGERRLKADVGIRVGGERKQSLGELRRLREKVFAELEGVLADARIGVLRGALHVRSLQRGVGAEQP